MIKPVNNHILIEPLKHESFISSEKGSYEEVGIVVDLADSLAGGILQGAKSGYPVFIGDKVFFDSWLAARYPKNDKEYFWLVRWEDVRAIEEKTGVVQDDV